MEVKQTKKEILEIDATARSLGRVASEAAVQLMGKNEASFQKHLQSGNKVKIVNASRLIIPSAKKDSKIYTRYSGYPGGLKKQTMSQLIKSKGISEVVKRAVQGMLPANKLRGEMMKNLEVIE